VIDNWTIDENGSTTEELQHLLEFIGQDLLFAIRDKAMKHSTREALEIRGQILGGDFTLRVSFDGGARH
jgi:hypothetical protein